MFVRSFVVECIKMRLRSLRDYYSRCYRMLMNNINAVGRNSITLTKYVHKLTSISLYSVAKQKIYIDPSSVNCQVSVETKLGLFSMYFQ